MDPGGDRAITVIGDRLTPMARDPLGWERLTECDGVFVSATDAAGLRLARQAKVLTATPRLRLPVLQEASLPLDALIGSGLDHGEQQPPGSLEPPPRLQIATDGDAGECSSPEADSAPSLCLRRWWSPMDAATALLPGLRQGWPLAGR